MVNHDIFGAKAAIQIPFRGTISELANKLAVALNIPEFEIAPSEYPPHDVVGSGEVLGWELWLNAVGEGRFVLEMQTVHAVDEIFHGRLHDLSPWLARLISVLCDVNAVPMLEPPDSLGVLINEA